MTRSIIAFLIALLVSFAATPLMIRLAKRIGAIDVPKDGRRVHKVPTPRLGGLAIFLGFLAALLYMYEIDSRMVGVLTGAAIIVTLGFFDDIKPLPAKFKFLVQIIAAAIVIRSGVIIPRISNPLYFLTGKEYIHFGIWSYPLTLIWIVGVTNAINLVDGLDGLAAGISIISAVTLFVAAQTTGQPFAAFLASILAASILGFLPYNFNPAKIFMGDTGSLALGGIIGIVAVMIKKELFLFIVGGVFVAEALSVIIQVGSFKLRKKRVFKMAPLHHHFELSGVPEQKIVTRMWIAGIILAIIGLSTLKIL